MSRGVSRRFSPRSNVLTDMGETRILVSNMAHEVLKQPILTTRSAASRRYLYFEQPPALWLADSKHEDHTAILKASRRTSPTHAGWMLAFTDELQIDANGSLGLQIPTRSAEVVYEYIQALRGKTKQQVILK